MKRTIFILQIQQYHSCSYENNNKPLDYQYTCYVGTYIMLTHWGRVTHICVGNLTIIVSYNGLSPDRCQVIIWAIAGIVLIGSLDTYFSEMLNEIHTFSFKKMQLKM